MTTLPRVTDYVTLALNELRGTLGEKVNRREGSRWDALFGGISAGIVRCQQVTVEQFDDVMLSRMSGPALDRYCASRSGGLVKRQKARAAVGTCTLTRPTAAAGLGEVPSGTEIRAPYQGKSYIFQVRLTKTIGAAATTVDVTVDAQTVGSASNVGTVAGGLALTGLPAVLFDSTLKPTSLTVSGGAEDENDDDLKHRMRMFELARRGGTAPAVAFGAMTAGVKHVVLAKRNDDHLGAQGVIYVGDRDWNSTQELRDEVATALEGWRAFGPALPVRGMSQSDVTIVGTVEMALPLVNYDIGALRTNAAAKAISYFDQRTDPYAFNVDMLKGRIARAHDDMTKVTLTSPGVSVVSPLTPSALALVGTFPSTLTRYRTRASLITLNFVGPT